MNILSTTLWISVILSGVAMFRYFLYLAISPNYEFQKIKILNKSKNLPKKKIEKTTKISVIVPAWNEEVGITTSIESLLKNSYSNLEIIVVNDGSKDNTNKVIRKYYKENIKDKDLKGKSFIYINKRKNAGKGAAINSGIKKSSGEIIVTMDADTRFDNEAISNVARYFQDKTIDAGVGNVKIANTKDFLGLVQQVEYTLGFYFKRTHSVLNSEYIIGGAFGIFRRNIFERCGFFDEKNKTEDIEFSTRIKNFGLKTIYIEDAIAFTEGPTTFKGLFQQRLRWKKGRMDTFLKYQNLFFSTEKKHNKFLCWFLLPTALLGDLELILFPIMTPIVLYITLLNQEFIYLIGWMAFLAFSILLSYLFGSKKNSWKSILLIPAFYFIAYLLVITEIYAMIGTIKLYVKNSEITWQTWNRRGLENV